MEIAVETAAIALARQARGSICSVVVIEGRMSARSQNEKKFRNWEDLPSGGRRYRLDVIGRAGWRARYLKDVDTAEVTLRFLQEIYDEGNNLVEVHEKFPIDTGHRKV